MSGKPENPNEDRMLTDEEREANRRFQETLGRLVNTPHKPHKGDIRPKEAKPPKSR